VCIQIALRESERAALRAPLNPAVKQQVLHAMMSEIITRKIKFWIA
jgi:hypothetical protein